MGLSAPIVGTPALINTGAASGPVVVPATAQVGDRLLLIVAYGGGGLPAVLGAGGVTGGSGGPWPTLPGFPVGGTAPGTALDIRAAVCGFRDIGATLTVAFNTATAKAVMWVEAWRDPNGTPEINQSSGKLAAAATALTTNSITPSKAGCWVMSVFTSRDSSIGTTYTQGTDSGSGAALTERSDQTNTGTSEVAAELCDTNAAVSSGVATVHSSTSSQSLAYCAGIVALAPGSFFPTDQQLIASQLHPGRTPSRVARFRQSPRSTEITTAGPATITADATITAAGTISATAVVIQPATATVTATGTVAAAAFTIRAATGTISAAGTISADAVVISGATVLTATASIPATGTISAAGTTLAAGSATIPATGTISAAATVIKPATATVGATGTISAAAFTIRQASATITATGTVAADGILAGQVLATATVSAAGTITASAVLIRTATATVTAAGTISGQAVQIRAATAQVTGAGTVTANGVLVRQATATISAAGTISATGVVVGMLPDVTRWDTGAGALGTHDATGATLSVHDAAGYTSGTHEVVGAAGAVHDAAGALVGSHEGA